MKADYDKERRKTGMLTMAAATRNIITAAVAMFVPAIKKTPPPSPESTRFKAVEQSVKLGSNKLYLLTDKRTHEQYLVIENTDVIYLNSLEHVK